jgi:hypothetical protein
MSFRRMASALALIAFLIGCFIFWIWRVRAPTTPDPAFPEAGNDSQRAKKISPERASLSLSALQALDPRQRLKHVFEVLNHNPIEFYGRAVDQFGEPIGAAEVQGSVLYNTGVRSGVTGARTITDMQGNFQFTDLMGQDLGIGIQKEGYEYHPRHTSFSYSYFEADHKRHQPDRNNPVVFLLWKKQGAEPLIHYDRVWRFSLTASPVKINLRSGEIDDTDADLVISISRNPLRMRYGQRGFAWNAVVEVVDGGLVQAGLIDYYNLAPEAGYQLRFEHTQEAQDLHEAQVGRLKWTWKESVADDFFISSHRGENFAHVVLRIRPNSDHREGDNEALVEAEVWLNPNGSRNLEFDPTKVIRLPQK